MLSIGPWLSGRGPNLIEQYVNDVLLGEGVSATNINFIGSTEQIGYMTGGDDVGFPSTAAGVEFGQRRGRFLCGSRMFELRRGPHRQRLLDIANSVPLDWSGFSVTSVNDLCVLEFDFDPAGDYVSFNYVFGSSNTRPGKTQYNDIFAFFLSGAGINGPYDALGRSRVKPSTSQAFPIQTLNFPSPSAL